jgi:uncharacterized membrane protein
MSSAEASDQTSEREILVRLREIEERLARIEEHLEIAPTTGEHNGTTTETEEETEEKLEIQLGQNWFAKVGIVVLTLGIVFLLTFPYHNLPPILPSLFGYILAGAIVTLSRFWRNIFQQISRYLLGGGLFLMYFSTFRLAHFTTEPIVTNREIEVSLLLLIVAVNLVVAARRESPYLAGLNLVLGYFTALVGGNAEFVFTTVSTLSIVAVYFHARYHWTVVSLLAIALAFSTHLLWAINNPFFGTGFQLVGIPEVNLLFLLLYVTIFATGHLIVTDKEENLLEAVGTCMNGVGFYGLLLLLTLISFKSDLVWWNLGASAVFLMLAMAFWIRRRSKFSTFVYSMLGYAALSIAIVSHFKMPDFFVWLCWQSVLVLSTAVWFRSRFIVVGNFVIYVIVFITYLVTAGTIGLISVGFGVVALLSARILNWQRDRLELKTELMRNAYLASALFVIPYALYHSVPAGFVSLSWLAVALGYYLISRLLKLRKYRWMALLTVALTIVYVFIVDLVRIDPALRIVSFLVVGIALLVISMVYSGRIQRKAQNSGDKKAT